MPLASTPGKIDFPNSIARSVSQSFTLGSGSIERLNRFRLWNLSMHRDLSTSFMQSSSSSALMQSTISSRLVGFTCPRSMHIHCTASWVRYNFGQSRISRSRLTKLERSKSANVTRLTVGKVNKMISGEPLTVHWSRLNEQSKGCQGRRRAEILDKRCNAEPVHKATRVEISQTICKQCRV